ncbi:MAG: hypothetical protein K5798_09920 [Nitrosopumilus sp.]|uniref:hypothetical protein n=1 Tax=Nitrosopumilus sp. TaxID=2024843 RepID=UPI0024333620|nr:hypothetical protein [Nitrosopumilus sp.]MCV0367561.1 hypothetical protein [Nitrosopumilus sp.]
MNSKIFVGVSLAIIALVGTITIILLENNGDSLTAEEINELEKQQSAYPGKSTFVGGNMQFLEEWCADNKGFWKEVSADRGECGFETRTQYHLASAVLDDLQQPEITGKPAQEICRFLALKCFSNSSFDGYYEINTGKTFVTYDYKGVEYRFDISDEDNITFTMNNSQESFSLHESTTLDAEFSIQVKTGYGYYQLGDKIAISGTVRDNHHILSQATFEHPVTIQIITNGELLEVAQLDIREDGQFQHIINTGGHVWKSGEYTIKTTYDIYTATTTFDMGEESRNLLEHEN